MAFESDGLSSCWWELLLSISFFTGVGNWGVLNIFDDFFKITLWKLILAHERITILIFSYFGKIFEMNTFSAFRPTVPVFTEFSLNLINKLWKTGIIRTMVKFWTDYDQKLDSVDVFHFQINVVWWDSQKEKKRWTRSISCSSH